MADEKPNGSEARPSDELSPRTRELLTLQRMEAALVRANLEHPTVIGRAEYERLRYALAFARLTHFQPGAAKAGGRTEHSDVDVREHVAPFRSLTLELLRRPLREERDPSRRLREAAAAIERLTPELEAIRDRVSSGRGRIVSRDHLDEECGIRSLVTIAGGGGGAGYVYIGAFRELERIGLVPAYLVGASIGAVLGCFRARQVPGDWDSWIETARQIRESRLYARPPDGRRFGIPGMFGLNLDSAIGPAMTSPSGARMRLIDMAIPFDVVVAGVRRRSFEQLPERFRVREDPDPDTAPASPGGPTARVGRAAAVAMRMWQVAAFLDPRVVKPIVLGADERTRFLNVVHAAGFSASIPGVLHYDVPAADAESSHLLSELFEREEIAALVDGGAASNVPAEQAWRQVQAGRIGTRNAVYLALDCFTPKWDPSHLWLQPITQGVQLQLARNSRFADWIVRFDRALSPATLIPSDRKLDNAIRWGTYAADKVSPMVRAMLEPVSWEQ